MMNIEGRVLPESAEVTEETRIQEDQKIMKKAFIWLF
jgi:hypothetical protein